MHIIRKRSLNQSSMKHIDLKYHFLREEISNGVIELRRVESARNITDIFTKALPAPHFLELRAFTERSESSVIQLLNPIAYR